MPPLTEEMIQAVINNDPTQVAHLLNTGQDINARNDSGETAFSYACANNSLAVAQLLHARGADINTIDHGNGSPLDWAAEWSTDEFCSWLTTVGGRRNDPPNPSPPPKRQTPADHQRLTQAITNFLSHTTSPTPCDHCHQPITFHELNHQAHRHACPCGKYNGSFQRR